MAAVKVAVLDDYQGLSSPIFNELGTKYEVTLFKDTLRPYNHPETTDEQRDELAKRLEPFEIISTMRERTPFPAALIARLPNLKLLLTTGGRNASLDLPAFRDRGIPVAGADDGGRLAHLRGLPDSTTQHTVALILAAARNLAADHESLVRGGGWQTGSALGLSGRVFGTLGLGRLGVSVARIMRDAFGMRIVAWSENMTQEKADEAARKAGLDVDGGPNGEKTFKFVGKEELFRTADVVSVHLVLSDRSRGIIAKKDLELMKPGAIFINTSRGPLVVERDLLDVLVAGKIKAAAIDVFGIEPLPLDSPWRTTEWGKNGRSQVQLSPHMGYVETDILQAWYHHQVDNIRRWENGEELVMKLA